MNIVDTKRNNVLLVFTNVMSFGNPNRAKKWHSQLRTKSKKLKNQVEKTLEVSPEVVWIENHYHGPTSTSSSEDDDDDEASSADSLENNHNCRHKRMPQHRHSRRLDQLRPGFAREDTQDEDEDDEEEEEGHDLPTEGEWTLLPDGTRQILNLYRGIAAMLTSNGDNLGLHTINTLFRNRYDGPVVVSSSWSALDAKRERDKFGQTEDKMLALLKRDYGLTETEEGADTEVKAKINRWIHLQSEAGALDELAAMEAFRLSVILVSQLKIVKEEQLISHSVGSIKQVSQNQDERMHNFLDFKNMPIPENLTRLHVRMLSDIFGVREEKRRPPVVSCLGRGYDIIHDEIKARNIFDFRNNEFSEAEYEIQVSEVAMTSSCIATCA